MTTQTWHKASALVPLALLSGSWTVMLAVSSAGAASEAPAKAGPVVPPAQAINAPASVSTPGRIAPAVPLGSSAHMVSTSTTNGIPAAALSAYQRAAQVIDSADPGCHLSWPLVAAIGRVESDHGRYGGSVLGPDGVSRPSIVGSPLDGSNGTARVADTDAGQYDGDRRFDRAVGPMQFIPSTWSVVGVDGDGDHKRNPQDIDDAALATAVYLCSGNDDLSTERGVGSAVYRYIHSTAYVDLVRSIADTYASGSYLSLPTGSASTVAFSRAYDDSVFSLGTRGHLEQHHVTAAQPAATTQTGAPTKTDTAATKPAPKQPATLQDVVTHVPVTVSHTLTELQQATAYCQEQLSGAQLEALGGLSACAQAYVDGGAGAVQGLLDSLGGLVASLLPKT